MTRIELVIRKEGDEYCLYTSDGERKLGCHPSRERAQAQEAAIKARQERAEKLMPPGFKEPHRTAHLLSTMIGLLDEEEGGAFYSKADLRTDLSDGEGDPFVLEVFDNGDVLKEVPLALLGDDFENRGQKFSMSEPTLRKAIENFEARGMPLPVTRGHVAPGRSDVPAAAWIQKIFLKDDGKLWGHVRFLKDTWSEIKKGMWKGISLEFYPNDVDIHGREIGMNIEGAGIVNKPFFPVRIDDEGGRSRGACLVTLTKFRSDADAGGNAPGGTKMADDKQDTKPPEPKVEGDRVTLTKGQFEALQKAQSDLDGVRAEGEELRSKLSQKEKDLERERLKNTANEIRSCINKLQKDHGVVMQLGDYAIESSDADCVAWLGTAPFGVTTLDGLRKLCADEAMTAHLPKVKLGGERGAGTDRLPPMDLTSEAGKAEAVRRRVAQMRRDFQTDELKFMLARRKQTIEEFARQELAGENRGVKF